MQNDRGCERVDGVVYGLDVGAPTVESREARLGRVHEGVGGWVEALLEDEDDSLCGIECGRCVQRELSGRVY